MWLTIPLVACSPVVPPATFDNVCVVCLKSESTGTENKRNVFLQATSSQNTAAGGRRTTKWFIGVTASWSKSRSPSAGCATSRSAPSPCKHRCPPALLLHPAHTGHLKKGDLSFTSMHQQDCEDVMLYSACRNTVSRTADSYYFWNKLD